MYLATCSAGVLETTDQGEIWMSGDGGGAWRRIAAHLPEIYSVKAVPAA